MCSGARSDVQAVSKRLRQRRVLFSCRAACCVTPVPQVGGEGGRRIISEVVDEISQMEGLKHINFTKYRERMKQPDQQPEQQPEQQQPVPEQQQSQQQQQPLAAGAETAAGGTSSSTAASA
jgi:hypothetical protein